MPTLAPLKRFFAGLLFVCLTQASTANAALLSLQPDLTHVSNGDTVSLDLIISELGEFSPDSLGTFDVSVAFDAAVLSFIEYSLSGFLGDFDLFTALDVSAGDTGSTINVAEVSLLSAASLNALQPGEFVLASLRFEVLRLVDGNSTQFSISPGAVLGNALGASLPVTTGAPATIVSVPLPGTLVLLLAGLLNLGICYRLRRHRTR